MDKTRRDSIFKQFKLLETGDLLEFWNSSNPEEWDNDVYEVVQDILVERQVAVPAISKTRQFEICFKNAKNHFQSEDFKNAKSEIDKAIKLDPTQPKSYILRGDIFYARKDYDPAIRDFQTAIKLDKESNIVWKKMRRTEKFLAEQFEASEEKQHLLTALELLYEGENQKASVECEKVKELLPPIAVAYNFYGLIMAEMGNLDSARDSFLVAVSLNRIFSNGWNNLRYVEEIVEEEKYFSIIEPQNSLSEPAMDASQLMGDSDQVMGEFDRAALLPQWVYLNKHSLIIRGWPGHRNRNGRYGLDPLDIYAEGYQILGIIIRKLFTFKFRTKNSTHLILMSVVGFTYFLPFFLTLFLIDDFKNLLFFIVFLTIFSVYWVPGLLLLINVGLSFKHIYQHGIEDSPNTFF
jgi:tetratricopeptide (TPR) repeat protein